MQKKILALAVAGLMSGAAFAQSNVTVYGLLDAGYASYSGTHRNDAGAYVVGAATSARINAINSGLASGSRLGFRGTEDLGSGLRATFTAEFSLNSDGGSDATGGAATNQSGLDGAPRQIFVGVGSATMGTVTLGRQYTPFWETVSAVDPFATTGVASAGVIHPTGLEGIARSSSSIKYVSPKMGGFTVSALYGMGERTDNKAAGATVAGSAKDNVFSVSGIYADGPLVVGLAYIKLSDFANDGVALPNTAWADLSSTAIGGVYNFGVARVAAAYNRYKSSNGNVADLHNGDWHLSARFPMGVHSFTIAYNKANDKTVGNDDASHWGLGYQYDLSKRTNFYAMYGRVSNKDNASYSVNQWGANWALGGGGGRTRGMVAGLRHSF